MDGSVVLAGGEPNARGSVVSELPLRAGRAVRVQVAAIRVVEPAFGHRGELVHVPAALAATNAVSQHQCLPHAVRAARSAARTSPRRRAPPSVRGRDGHAPANILGIRHVAFAVDDIDAAVATVRARGGELVGEVENYEDIYRLCYVRGPEGIIVELAERIG